jgi:membrane-bound serine protease (ClpP class)
MVTPLPVRHLAVALWFLACATGLALAQAQEKRVLVLDVRDAIGPAAAEYIASGLERAVQENAPLVVLRMDTPGGLETSMRQIIRDILASPVPVATFVAPSGARAASAGTYILYASHIAAMAPGTNLGAATPVNLQGPPTELPDQPTPAGKEEDDGAKRGKGDASAANDSAAYIESLAELRGRNAEWAVKAVREAASLPSSKALEANVIDVIAEDVPTLLEALDGRTVEVGGEDRVLRLAGLPVESIEPSWRIELLSIITNPNVALLLMMVGVYGLILEFYNPGTFIAGTIGGISLLLGLYALNVLPVNYAGVALIALGLALIVAEALTPSFGMLGIGGGAAFVVGATLLFETESPEFQVSPALTIAMVVVLGSLTIFLLGMALRAQRRPIASGEEAAAGTLVHVIDWRGTAGTVLYRGERWKAEGPPGIAPGESVVVTGRNGLTLAVASTETSGGPSHA